MNKRRRFGSLGWRCTVAILAVAGLCSCKSELYGHLDERDANEMLAVLFSAGIHADKTTPDEKTWTVEVADHELPAALRIVATHGLPREQFVNVGEVFKKEGLISTPSEERIRYIYAVSQELSNTLSQIDGVIVARVHPVIPANDPLATEIRPSSASVFIKYRRDADVEALAPPIKNLIMRSIEGLHYENISLTFVPAEKTAEPVISAPEVQGAPVKAMVGGGIGMMLMLALAGLGLVWNRYWPGRMPVSGEESAGDPQKNSQQWATQVK
jgi:type III secretion protein J